MVVDWFAVASEVALIVQQVGCRCWLLAAGCLLLLTTDCTGAVTAPGQACSNVCPAGTGVSGSSTVCTPCMNGTFNAGNSQFCAPCPRGTSGVRWQSGSVRTG